MSFREKAANFVSSLLVSNQAPLDLSVFGDPLAQATAWHPLKNGGANFCTHRLVETDLMTLEFKPTFGMKAFCFVFVFMGLAACIFPPFSIYKQYGGFNPSILFVILVGSIFFAAGLFMYNTASQPIIFDTKRRLFSKGTVTSRGGASGQKNDPISIDRIRGLQVLSEYCRGNESSYYSYELNLVLDDASRVNVVDHGSLDALRADAKKLSQALGIPVWDTQEARVKAASAAVKKPDGFSKIDAWEK